MTDEGTEIAEFVTRGELADVRFFALEANLLDEPNADVDDDAFQQGMVVKVGREPGIVEVRVELAIQTKEADYRVVAATQFRYEPLDLEVSADLGREFAERVGIMAIYPYLREAVQSLAARLRQPSLTLPLMRTGEASLAEARDDGTNGEIGTSTAKAIDTE